MPIHALEDGCFKNYKVLGVSGVIERVNQADGGGQGEVLVHSSQGTCEQVQ